MMNSGPVVTLTETFSQPVDVIWSIITDPELFHGLSIPHVYSPYDTGTIRVGSVTMCKSVGGGGSGPYPRYVTEHQPQNLFSIGHAAGQWTYRWQLESNGESTQVTFSREFAKPNLFERIFQARQHADGLQSLAQKTMDHLREGCDNLSRGEEHGIFRTRF